MLKEFSNYLHHEIPGSCEPDVLEFGLRLIINSTINFILLMSVAYTMGILPTTFVIFCVIGSIKVFSGGAHANHPVKCIFMGTGIFLLLGYTAKVLSLLPSKFFIFGVSITKIVFFEGLGALLGLILIIMLFSFAPVEAEGKPLKSQMHRKKLKTLAFISTYLWVAIGWLAFYGNFMNIYAGIMMGFLWHSISLHPKVVEMLKNI